MFDSLTLGIVVAVYPEGPAVDLVLADDGRRLRGVQVMVGSGTSSTGRLDLPDVGGPTDDSRWNVMAARERDMRAVVAFLRGVPIVIGFLLPAVNQVTFNEPNRRIDRHASDWYTSVDDAGNFEAYHPSGTYLRIGEAAAHEDLTAQDFDGRWKIERNTAKAVHVQLTVKAAGVQKASLNIDPAGNVTLTHAGNFTLNAGGDITLAAGGAMNLTAAADVTVVGANVKLNP